MAFAQRKDEQDYVTPKEREKLATRRQQFADDIDQRLTKAPDYAKPDLTRLRDHCFSKFPVIPRDLSIWEVAYYEDWLREYNKHVNPEL